MKSFNCYADMNIHEFDWGLVRSFLAALEKGSLLGAARLIGKSQPTVGRHIAELETQLGTVLFERTGRGLLPTPMALRLADAARTMEQGANALTQAVTGAQAGLEGVVRLSASQPVACVLLPPVLARLHERWPGISLELVVTNAISDLLRREADIALRMVRPRQPSLISKRIGEVIIHACAHRDYLRKRGIPATALDLQQHDIVADDRQGDVIAGFKAMGLEPPRAFPLSTDDLMAYWAAVRAGMGIGFVADYVIRTDPAIQRLAVAGLRLPRFPVWLTVHREIRTTPRIRAVFDFLAQEVSSCLRVGQYS